MRENPTEKVAKKKALKKKKKKAERAAKSKPSPRKRAKQMIVRMLAKLKRNQVSPMPPGATKKEDHSNCDILHAASRRLSKLRMSKATNAESRTSQQSQVS